MVDFVKHVCIVDEFLNCACLVSCRVLVLFIYCRVNP